MFSIVSAIASAPVFVIIPNPVFTKFFIALDLLYFFSIRAIIGRVYIPPIFSLYLLCKALIVFCILFVTKLNKSIENTQLILCFTYVIIVRIMKGRYKNMNRYDKKFDKLFPKRSIEVSCMGKNYKIEFGASRDDFTPSSHVVEVNVYEDDIFIEKCGFMYTENSDGTLLSCNFGTLGKSKDEHFNIRKNLGHLILAINDIKNIWNNAVEKELYPEI